MNPVLTQITEQISAIILGKQQQIRLALACLLARGHLLIEDVPGVGKTMLAHALAKTLGLQFQRIQFTSDMLPADILGISIYDRNQNQFSFHSGPIFSQVLLADEINRATPKTQSALLEAMEEHQVTVEGETRKLPEPFFVIATQNPAHLIGTFPLPESQLDRFLMRIDLGFPDHAAERALLQGKDRRMMIAMMQPCINPTQLVSLQSQAEQIHVSEPLLDYVQALIDHTRRSSDFIHGLSPRAGLALLAAARAWAMLEGEDKVLPEHVQRILPGIINHRLHSAVSGNQNTSDLAKKLIEAVAIP
jgi:MoxR-like ATPase